MWSDNQIFYQIYPLGFCGCPKENDGICRNRIGQISQWIFHFKKLGITSIYFSPIFESDRHGYDTRDYKKVDVRLGSNADFALLCKELKDNGIRIVLDGVFNHVGRGFWAFQDVLAHRESSAYKDWFHIDFYGNSCYNDGFYYEGWEGHYELVKLNLHNPVVTDYLFNCIRGWIEEFDIDGLRLDVAYCLDHGFMQNLRRFCKNIKEDFFLLGEVLFGDYNRIVNPDMLDSCTNYECYKGLYSSFNDLNFFEISHSLNRQFGKDPYTIYSKKHLLAFVDNHDVNRIASMLRDKNHLPLIYGMLFSMPGIPCIYYGSEWGIEGVKENGSDDGLRPALPCPQWNDLTGLIAALSAIRKEENALIYGDYQAIILTNRQIIFQREFENERIWIGINADSCDFSAFIPDHLSAPNAVEMLSGKESSLCGNITLPAYSLSLWKLSSH